MYPLIYYPPLSFAQLNLLKFHFRFSSLPQHAVLSSSIDDQHFVPGSEDSESSNQNHIAASLDVPNIGAFHVPPNTNHLEDSVSMYERTTKNVWDKKTLL